MLLDGESSVSFFPSSLLILICWTARPVFLCCCCC